MKRYTYQEVIETRERLIGHAKLNRAVRVPYHGLRKTVVGALMVTTSPELMKVHPAYAAAGAWDRRYVIARIPFVYSSGYDKDTDTFANLCSANAAQVALQDQRLSCLRCKDTTEYEGEAGVASCMGCLVEGPDYSDGLGNRMRVAEGDTVVWFSDMTFALEHDCTLCCTTHCPQEGCP